MADQKKPTDQGLKQSQIPKFRDDELSFEDNANALSKCLVSYLNPLLRLGASRTLQHVDLGPTSKIDRCSYLHPRFVKFWEEERKLPLNKQSLWRVLWRTVGYDELFWALFLYAASAAVTYGPVMILNDLVKYCQGTLFLDTGVLWLYVALIFALPMLSSIFAAQSNVFMAHISLQFRNALVNMIYRKSLKLSPASKQKTSTGQIVNMFSNDTQQLQRFLFFMNNVVVAPAQIAISLGLIYMQVGPATFVGLGLMVVLMPLNVLIFGLLNTIRRKKVKVTDQRVKLMNEILAGIRVIKFYAWERAFEKKVTAIREQELILLKQLAYVVAVGFTFILMAAPIVQPVLVFYTYMRLGNKLDEATAFTTIALFNILQFPFAFLPMGLAQYSQAVVSTKRMLDYFSLEELPEYVHKDEAADGTVVSMKDAYMCWILEAESKKEDGDKAGNKKKSEADTKMVAQKKGVADGESATASVGDVALVVVDGKLGDEAKEGESTSVNRSVHTLEGITFNVKKGQLIAVVGAVGSGKSSLLSGLLGEMHLREGTVRMSGSVAFCDQRPWILNDTVQENILFGLPYDEAKFDRAISVACMEDDIKILPGGINTEIGERGINLSGGQKARVALARAVYRDADVYLLDDPLSAVDAHVGQHIFHECILTALQGKTRVLVTHHVHLLQHCDQVLVLESGHVKAVGSYEDLRRSGIDIEAFVPKHTEEEEEEEGVVAVEGEEEVVAAGDSNNKGKMLPSDVIPAATTTTTGSSSVVVATAVPAVAAVDSDDVAKSHSTSDETATSPAAASADKEDAAGGNGLTAYKMSKEATAAAVERRADSREKALTTKEEKNEGQVSWSIYSYYVRAGGLHWFAAVLCFIAAGQVLQIYSNFWLAGWGAANVSAIENGNDGLSESENLYYLDYYALYCMCTVIALTVRALFMAQHRLGTSTKLHSELLKCTLGAPVAFFDVTPLGRILNRFSSDMVTVDEDLSQTISQLTNSMAQCVGAIAAIAGATKGTFLALLVPIMWVYDRLQRYFRASNTAIARLEAVSRSPIYADFSQALSGLTSIRAYGESERFVRHLEERVDSNTIAGILNQIISQWLAIRLDFIGSLTSFFIAILAIATLEYNFLPAGFLALGLMYSFQMTTYLKFAVRMIATFEAQLNSVERIIHYIDNIEQEDERTLDSKVIVPDSWPSEGRIESKDLQMRYRDGPLVLKGLDFKVLGGEKIGIAGRTGSGKSSTMIALFRIQELAGGSIRIDDIDISTIPLATLRSRLGIIPQDPVLFSASVRFNLDPFDQYTDAQLWEVLESVDLKDHASSLPNKLQEEVAEGGDNFSAGQRQLICIARALLRKPKILVLDEATASIDNETDGLIQRMVRSNFKNSTVLTIAHRLHTIIDSDRIMVLDSGLMSEFDRPDLLLQKDEGAFKGLWQRHQKSHGYVGTSSSKGDLAALVAAAEGGDVSK